MGNSKMAYRKIVNGRIHSCKKIKNKNKSKDNISKYTIIAVTIQYNR